MQITVKMPEKKFLNNETSRVISFLFFHYRKVTC